MAVRFLAVTCGSFFLHSKRTSSLYSYMSLMLSESPLAKPLRISACCRSMDCPAKRCYDCTPQRSITNSCIRFISMVICMISAYRIDVHIRNLLLVRTPLAHLRSIFDRILFLHRKDSLLTSKGSSRITLGSCRINIIIHNFETDLS